MSALRILFLYDIMLCDLYVFLAVDDMDKWQQTNI